MVVSNYGKLSDEEKDEVYQNLLKENEIDIEQNTETTQREDAGTQAESSDSSKRQVLYLQKLTHVKGVNALIPNQSVILSPACTVMFGLNGTGKSGYFRIIHELAGGIKSKNICICSGPRHRIWQPRISREQSL